MTTSGSANIRERQEAQLVDGLRALIARYGDAATAASAPVNRAVEQLREALASGAEDGNSLSALDIARIRLGKFAASRLPPEVWRDPTRLAALRAEILELARRWLGNEVGAP